MQIWLLIVAMFVLLFGVMLLYTVFDLARVTVTVWFVLLMCSYVLYNMAYAGCGNDIAEG